MIDFLLGCSLWYASCSKLRGIVTQKPDRATLKGLCHAIFVSFQKAKSVFASTEFQK